MNAFLRSTLALACLGLTSTVIAQITFYEQEGFRGRSFSTPRQVDNFQRQGFNDRASSVVVSADRWEVCESSKFDGRCVVLRQGNYPSLAAMGLDDRISSTRRLGPRIRVEEERYAPPPLVVNDYRRRPNERLFQAEVLAVRAVVGTPQQRCWIEREQVSQQGRGDANVPAAIAGAFIGGILGHQIGGGRGQDLATVGGVVAGAAMGANIGRDERGRPRVTQDVQHCSDAASAHAPPDYWDVTYLFRGREHRVQMSAPPGPSITVNAQGEPRA